MTVRYRRVSKDLHDRCFTACVEHRAKLTVAEFITLSKVATSWGAADFDVTKVEYDTAKLILDRIGVVTASLEGKQ